MHTVAQLTSPQYRAREPRSLSLTSIGFSSLRAPVPANPPQSGYFVRHRELRAHTRSVRRADAALLLRGRASRSTLMGDSRLEEHPRVRGLGEAAILSQLGSAHVGLSPENAHRGHICIPTWKAATCPSENHVGRRRQGNCRDDTV